MTKKLARCLPLALACLVSLAAALAQEPHHSRISIVHPGFEPLKGDIKAVIDLTTPAEQEQWVNLQDYIDMFQIGIDGNRPVRVDMLSGTTPTSYLVWVPLLDPGDPKKGLADEFRDSLDAFGYVTTRDVQDRNLYRIENSEGASDMGWLRVLPDIQYGIFVLTTDEQDMQLLKQLVLKAGDPRPEVAAILSSKAGVGAEGINAATAPADMAKRREAFVELRRVSMDALQKRPEESKTEFEMRQSLLTHQLDEGERLMVEAKEIRLLATLDRAKSTAALVFTTSAISGTSLDATIRQFGTQPDAFAGIAKPADSALSLRLNHPLDEMRQKNAIGTLAATRRDIDSRIDESKELTATEQQSTKKMLSGILEIIEDGLKTGHLNAFLESVPKGVNKFTTVGAISAVKATRLNDIIPLLKTAGQGNDAELNVDRVGDVAIHRIRLKKGYVTLFDRFFGDEQDVFIGASDKFVWVGSGPDGLETLKKYLATPSEPKTSTTALHMEVRALPWVKRLEEVAKTSKEGTTPEEKERQRSGARRRARAIAAMETNDLITIDVKAENGVVSGEVTFDQGIMKFVGKMLSAFSKDNLDG